MALPQQGISLADLSTAGIRLQPAQSVAITWDIIQRVQHGYLAGIPAADALRLMHDGSLGVEGDDESSASVERAGRLLDSLLPGFDAPAQLRAPGALRILVARALRTLDLPPFRSLEEFAQAISRFVADDPADVVRSLCAQATDTAAPAVAIEEERETSGDPRGLTISDIRRARRSTGLTLAEIAATSHIPVSLLRELEWGYFTNWPGDQYGRVQLVRYARAAGLDEQVVIETVWPLLQQAIRSRGTRVIDGTIVEERDEPLPESTFEEDPERQEPVLLIRRAASLPQPLPRPQPSIRKRTMQAVAAIAALLVVSLVPALWNDTASPVQPFDSSVPTASIARPEPPAGRPTRERARPTVPGATAPAVKRVPASVPATPPAAQPAGLRQNVAFSPTFASTGSAMFYHSAATGSSALMRADTDETGAVLRITRIVNDNAQNFHARPSPDGRLIAFDSDRDGERAVYIADADGQNVRRVSGEGFAAVPSWSPDGRRLAFVRAEPDRPRVWNLWMTDLATGQTTRLTSHTLGQPWGAAWFPDGEHIAYSREDQLIVRALDGSTQKVYSSPRKGRMLRTPAVSPDGRRIMFQVYKDGGWMLDLQDGSMTRILTDPTAEEFSWSPDGRRIAYHSRQSGTWGVWMMAPR